MLIIALPASAVTLVVARRREQRLPVLLGVWLATSGLLAMVTFWLFYAEPLAGRIAAFSWPAASVAVIAWIAWRRELPSACLRKLADPLLLWVLGTYFIVFLGFAHGGATSAEITGQTRFSMWQLPSDNTIPGYFAAWFYGHGHHGTPPIFPGQWQFSDRPPLQVGYVLSQMGLDWGTTDLSYQLTGVALQQLWIVGLWSLLKALRVERGTITLTMGMALVSGFALVNGFFIWPKLLPAAMLLGAAALALGPDWHEDRQSLPAAALIGTLAALAMLGHGSSVFGILGLATVALFRGRLRARWLVAAAVAAAVVYLPWAAYQHWGDPPGNRLVKWMLAGNPAVDTTPVLATIRHAYSAIGFTGALHLKAQNYETMIGWSSVASELGDGWSYLKAGDLGAAVSKVREVQFFNLLPTLGLLAFTPLMMVARARSRPVRARAEWRASILLWSAFVAGAALWGLLMFGDAQWGLAIIHQGSYLIPLLGFAAAITGARAALPRATVALVALNACLSLAIYGPVLAPAAGTSYSPVALFISGASLVAFFWVCADAPRPGRPQGWPRAPHWSYAGPFADKVRHRSVGP